MLLLKTSAIVAVAVPDKEEYIARDGVVVNSNDSDCLLLLLLFVVLAVVFAAVVNHN